MRKSDVKELIKKDKKSILNDLSFFYLIYLFISKNNKLLKFKYMKFQRLSVYYKNYSRNIFCLFLFLFFSRKKNRLGRLLNLEIEGRQIGGGIKIYHGNIIINENSIIGKNCSFHGNNCVGNNGFDDKCPVIGNDVDIGIGAKVIGNVHIADGVIIGAGAIVIKDINEEGSVWVGVPARKVR